MKDKAEEYMLWNINTCNSNLWWDNWIGFRGIAQVINIQGCPIDQHVSDIIVDGTWQMEHLQLPEYLDEHTITLNIGNQDLHDFLVWMTSYNGIFFSASC